MRVEIEFNQRATSPVVAVGLTQLMLPTASFVQKGITKEELYDRDTNLRIGFRFLKDMLAQFDQDLQMALLAYNRGPGRVVELMTRGEDPSNGYAQSVMKGVKTGS